MKNQYLLLSASTTIAIGIITAIASNSTLASDLAFSCQSNEGTPTTIAKNSSGTEQPIFHWKLDEASISNTPEELCNSVTQKLNTYATEGNDLSALTFKPASVMSEDEEMTSLPAICVAGEGEPCKLPLFTLEPAENSLNNESVASNALNSILDPALQANPVKSPGRDRGVQSTSYQVNIWDLLGL